MPLTQAEIDATAQRLRSLGLPDYLNRWLTMTPTALAANEAARKQMQTNHQRRTTMTTTIGTKEAALREQRTAEAKATAAEPAVEKALKAKGATPPKKPHPADAAGVMVAGQKQIEEAVSFTATLRTTAGGNSAEIKREGKTLEEAQAHAKAMEQETGTSRRALVHAIGKDGRAYLVSGPAGQAKPKPAATAPADAAAAKPAKPPKPAKPAAKGKPPAKPKAPGKPAKPAPKAKAGGKAKARYDWEAAAQQAAKGAIPKAPPLAASTGHLGQLEAVIEAAKAKDKKTLAEYKRLPPTTYGRKVVGQYAKLCLQALGA